MHLEKHKDYLQRASRVILPGSQSYLKIWQKGEYSKYFTKAKGPYVWDIDSNKYIDLFLGSGVIILGHGNEEQLKAITSQLQSGASVSMHHPAEMDVAEWFSRHMSFAEYTAFFKTGSEAAHASVRIARSLTKKPLVLSLGYHGWLPPFEDDKHIIAANCNEDDLETILDENRGKIGAIIVSPEPETLSSPIYRLLQDQAEENQIIFIMDEIKSGLRASFPSVSSKLHLSPDICLFGKALSNGFPLAALVCKKEIAKKSNFEYFSTYATEPLSLIAARETLRILEHGEYQKYTKSACALYTLLRGVIESEDIHLIGEPTYFKFEYPSHEYALRFTNDLAMRGILLHPDDDILLSSCHTETIIQETGLAISETLGKLA
jgi:glutamate-1-semialdehyde 2,1-aminomutase